MEYSYYYLARVQYLGFRFNGWQKQPGMKTIEGMLYKTLRFILPDRELKILGAGRTDAKVSSLEGAFEIFLKGDPIEDLEDFIKHFNINLPSDIKILTINKVNKKFNIINDSREKEYVYFFSFGAKNHPFSAPFITGIHEVLDIDLMMEGARCFEGTHNFRSYTTKSSGSRHMRRVSYSQIMRNELLTANFFPENSFVYFIRGEGFLRYQVRMIMGALILLGKGQLSLHEIKSSIKPESTFILDYVAPGSGLMLKSLSFNEIG